MAEKDEDILSEISILPDGRMYVFGMTHALLEVLVTVPTRDSTWQDLLEPKQSPPATVSLPEREDPHD